jgi:hypothetical protein
MANKVFIGGLFLAAIAVPLGSGGDGNIAATSLPSQTRSTNTAKLYFEGISSRQISARDPATTGSVSPIARERSGLSPTDAEAPRHRSATAFVISGPDLSLRDRASLEGHVLEKLPMDARLRELERREGWVLVRARSGSQGWVPASSVTAEDARTAEARKWRKWRKHRLAKRLENVRPVLRTETVVRLLIRESIARHPGPCACPYHPHRGRTLCKTRSAHSRGGPRAPLCFASDITPAMVAAYGERPLHIPEAR